MADSNDRTASSSDSAAGKHSEHATHDPSERDKAARSEVEPVGLLEGLATTRAIRRYKPDPISDEDLSTILWHAGRAPSGSNRQKFRFLVLRDGPLAKQAKALLGEAFRAGWKEKSSTDGYIKDGYVENVPDSPKERMARTMQHFVDNFEQAPVVVLACLVRYRAATHTEGASVYPAVQNLLLAARALGYGGVITGWHSPVEPELRELLSIPTEVAIHAVVPLGRPVGKHGPVRRLPLSEIVYDDRWGNPASWAVEPDTAPDTEPDTAAPTAAN